jgi:hypothetical protein
MSVGDGIVRAPRTPREKLALSEEQLRLALEVAEIGQWDVDNLTGTMFWPPRVKAYVRHLARRAVTLQDFTTAFHPETSGKTRAAYEAAATHSPPALTMSSIAPSARRTVSSAGWPPRGGASSTLPAVRARDSAPRWT